MTIESKSPHVRVVPQAFWKAAVKEYEEVRDLWLQGASSNDQAMAAVVQFGTAVRYTDVSESLSECATVRAEAAALVRDVDGALRDSHLLYEVVQQLATTRVGGDDLSVVRRAGYSNYQRHPGACAFPYACGPNR